MLGFLKRLVNKPTTIQVVGLEAGVARFRCSKRLRPPVSLEAVAVLPGGQQFLVQVEVTEVQPNGHYAGRLGPPSLLARLAECFAKGTNQRFYKVGEEPTHHLRSYLVRSRDIPNYKGMTTDLSMVEARLALDGPVQVGRTIEITLELDDPRVPSLPFQCQVISSSPLDSGGCQVDVRWAALTAKQEALLKSHLKKLKQDLELDAFKRE